MKRVYSVLIAEDESEIRRALAAMVEEHPSFRVAGCAGDGKAALRMIEALRPDVLMTDIRMPYMDGLELLQALDVRGIRIKTVIISGYSSFSYARTAMKYGASDYLLKPLLPAQCQQTLDLLEKALDLQAGRLFTRYCTAEAVSTAADAGGGIPVGCLPRELSLLRRRQGHGRRRAACIRQAIRAGRRQRLCRQPVRPCIPAAVRADPRGGGADGAYPVSGGLSGLFRHHSRCVFPPCSGRTDADTAGTCRKLRQQIRQQIQPGKMQFTLWWEHANTGTDAPPVYCR